MAGNGEEQDSMYAFDESNEEPESYDVGDTSNQAEGAEGDVTTDEISMDDPELEAIKARVREMEEEAEKIKAMQSEVEKQMNLNASGIGSPPAMSAEEKLDADLRSIWIGNVDYGATAEELEAHFHGCGSINRVTILCDKFSGHPKGFAYMEFADKDAVNTAMALDDSLFRGRQIKVTCKRTNRPGVSTTNRAPRGRPFRARGASYHYGYAAPPPRFRGRGGYRPRRPYYYSPY